jgi:serine/threonine-protein kinase
MGVVYRARHLKLNRVVALKMVRAGAAAGPDELTRFLGEAEAVAALQHPHIVPLYDFGQHDGLPFFTLEFAPRGSLAAKLNGTSLAPEEAARVVEQLARGIHYAHGKGVIHRDLKPANVLLAEDGTPKVTDFGLAKRVAAGSGLTASGAILGTPSYMAPEQAGGAGKRVGPAADVYALGAILYECLTGRPPFRAAVILDTLLQVMTEEPASVRSLQPGVPADLETICHRCLQKEPGRRYASAEELAEDLRRFQAGEPIRARPVGAVERAVKWVKRRPAQAGLLGATILVIWLFPVIGCGLLLLAPAMCLVSLAGIWSERRLVIAGILVTLTYATMVVLFRIFFEYIIEYVPHTTFHVLLGLLGAAILWVHSVRAIREDLKKRGD